MNKRPSKKKQARSTALRVFRDAHDEINSVLDQFEEDATQQSGSNRTSRRQSFRDLECHVDIFHAPGSAPTSCIVPTRDLSTNGISFLHRSYLHTGSQISVHLRSRSGEIHTFSATIMRCRYVKGLIHEIGAEFAKPIDLGSFVELEPLKLVMLFEDDSAAQVANHQFMCAGAEAKITESPEDLVTNLSEHEYDAVVFQGSHVTEDLVKQIRELGFARSILALAMNDDAAELNDRADRVFDGPVSPKVATDVVAHLRAA